MAKTTKKDTKPATKSAKKESAPKKPISKKKSSALQTVACKSIAQPIGPYRLGKTVTESKKGQWLYTSGQIGMLPDASLISNDDVVAQAVQALKNLTAVCKAAGFDVAKDTVKTTVYLT